jgi:hypothetical protein
MAYTTIDDPSAYFQTALYNGNAGTQSIVNDGNSDLQPDMVWIKCRSGTHATENHNLFDSVRGANKFLIPNGTTASSTDTNSLTAFNTDGFSLGTRTDVNGSGAYVGWNWKAGTALNNSAGANGGSIATTGSINTDAGFGIVKYVGTGSNATIYHGLGKIPKMIITKNIDQNYHWTVYTFNSNTKILRLNGNNAEETESAFQSTDPTATIQSLGTHNQNNGSGDTHISYMFCDVPGYQKVGKYTGNGSTDGVFIQTGFSVSWFMIKRTDSASSWRIWDNKRDPFNVRDTSLNANESGAEYTDASVYIDFLSNGVKFRNADDNVSGASYIYIAIAESPFVTSTGIPTTAR